jgi:hypothetical protein
MIHAKTALNFSFSLSLILGLFFPDLIVSLSLLFFLVYAFKYKLFFYFNKKPLIIFFAFRYFKNLKVKIN